MAQRWGLELGLSGHMLSREKWQAGLQLTSAENHQRKPEARRVTELTTQPDQGRSGTEGVQLDTEVPVP